MMRRLPIVVSICVVAGLAGLWVVHKRNAASTDAQNAAHLIPVLVTPSAVQDVPVYLNAIGTVQALNTVNIRPMVDGPLIDVLFKEGQDVKAGDVLARIDPRTYRATYDQYVAKKAQDEAQLANARLDLTRYRTLETNAYTPRQTADTQRATVAADEALVRQDQAQIDSARTQLGYTDIISPIDGRTGLRQIDHGNIVHSSDTTPITVVTQLKPIFVVFTLPQQNLPQIQGALREGSAEVIALPQTANGVSTANQGILDHGTLTVLDNAVDSTTGTLKMKATFPNADLNLWPGGFVNTRLKVQTLHQAVTILPAAIQRGPSGPYVYVVDADHKAKHRDIKLGYQDEQLAVVTEGLQGNEQVVTDGASRLDDGAKVQLPTDSTSDNSNQATNPASSHHHGRHGSAGRTQ